MLFVIILLLVFITQAIFAEWWLIIPVSFITSLFLGKSGWIAFFSGFLAVGLIWFGQAFFLDYRNESLLSGKIGQIFNLSSTWLLVVTAGIGAVTGGFSALTGYSIKALFKKRERNAF
jgi:hypothetical protein